MTDSMVERVARAIAGRRFEADGERFRSETGGVLHWQDWRDIAWKLYVYDARIVLQEMEMPTKAMLDRANVDSRLSCDTSHTEDDFQDVWVAMVKAAQAEPVPK